MGGGLLSVQGTFGVWIDEHALNAQEDSLHVIHGRPFFLENIQANVSAIIDVCVKNGSEEDDGGWFVRILRTKSDG